MKALKIIFNILGILTAAILSLILFATLLTTPIVSTAASFLNSETLYKVVKGIDFTQLITNVDNNQQNQLHAEILNELMETEFVEDLVTLYADNLFLALAENNTNVAITSQDISDLANKHFDELLPIVKSNIGTDLPLSDVEIQQYAQQYIDQITPEIASMLPTLNDLNIDASVITALHNLYSGKTLKIFQFVIGILTLLILLCRFPRFKGFMWLGTTYLCAAVFLFLLAFTVKSTGISLFTDLIPISKFIVTPLFSGLTAEVFKGAGIIFALAAGFIIIFILGRKLFCKKQPVQQMAA